MTNAKTKKNRFKNTTKRLFSIRIFNCICLALFFVLSLSYVFGVNDLSIKGFVLYEKKVKISDFKEKNKELELMIMSMESNNNLTQKAEEMELVVADNIEYMLIPDDMVAIR